MDFKFVTVPDPSQTPKPSKESAARSHAIRFALSRQRFQAEAEGRHFVTSALDKKWEKQRRRSVTMTLPTSIRSESIDPFETLSVSADRLSVLLSLRSSVHAGEPLFTINNVINGRGLPSVFGSGLIDGALAASLCLTLALAANKWQLNQECLILNAVSIRFIRLNLENEVTASTALATLGAVLLQLGIAYRMRQLNVAQTHLSGIKMLLSTCKKRGVPLAPALLRGLYWQDLFSSMIVGTERIRTLDDCPMLNRNLIVKDCVRYGTDTPTGFACHATLIGEDLVVVAAQVKSFCHRNWRETYSDSALKQDSRDALLYAMSDVQARLEGKLHDMRRSYENPIRDACILALILCVYGVWDGIWTSRLIPHALTEQLLETLSKTQAKLFTDDRSDLLFWLFCIGSSFAPDSEVRLGFANLPPFVAYKSLPLCSEDPQAWACQIQTLERFVWSKSLHDPVEGSFWQRIGQVQLELSP